LIFTCAFGISANAALYPDNLTDKNWYNIIRKFFDFAYWPIFGDTSNLEELEYNFYEKNTEMPCPNKSGQIYAYILFIIYIIIMNGLIANLLITIFG
jgi:hypothetical protein